jgi:hypothetical protein
MKTGQGLREAFIVTRQAAKAAQPAETAFDDPATREQDKATFGIRQLDDFKLNAMLCGVLHGLVARVALVDKGDLYCFASDFLDFARQVFNLFPVLFVGGSHAQRQQMTQRVNRHVNLAAFLALGPIISGSRSAFWAGLQRSTVEDRAVGRAFRPSASLNPVTGVNTSRRSCTMASNTPALSQHCPCW